MKILFAKTHFSVGESVLSPEDVVEIAARDGYTHVAHVDTLDVSALPLLQKAAEGKSVDILPGMAVRVVDDLLWRKPAKGERKTKNPFVYLNVFATDEQGFKELLALITLANSENNFYQRAQLSFEQVLEAYSKGNLLITTGSVFSLFEHRECESRLQQLASVDSERLFIESPMIDTPYYGRIRELAATAQGQKISSSMVLFKDTARQRDVFEAVLQNQTADAPWLQRAPDEYAASNQSLYLATTDSASQLSAFLDKIAMRFKKLDVSLPKMADKPFHRLVELCRDGWASRINASMLGYQPDASQLPKYEERLRYELGVINRMGFCDYFLLVHDIVSWCKANGIEVGPGRGSVGGSLIAYLIGITDVDPIRFGLFFERFINPERIDLPDIDLDFMSSRREEVFAYLVEKYGRDFVGQISNYSSLQAAGVLRGVGKAYGLSEFDYRCSKLVPKEHGVSFTLEEAMQAVPEIEQFATEHPEVWRDATALQKIFRGYATHAAGVIVCGEPLRERAALFTRDGQTVNWDKNVAEDMGLIKLDILGLSTLDLLKLGQRLVKERHGIEIDYRALALDDKKTIENFSKGNTVGVFQFESGGMRQLLKSLALGEKFGFEELVAATALYRPGPMDSGLMDKFVSIRQGVEAPSYSHPNAIPALEETGSVIVYQEQVMQIARDLAGFSMAESDKLRKAMGKKKPEEMAKFRQKFIDGAGQVSGLTDEAAGVIFDQIEKFAGYAFNKSHSVEYAIISYWSMWLKTHYQAEFYAAALTILGEEKQETLAREMRKIGLMIMPPDINISSDRFEISAHPAYGTVLYAPFQVIKGLSVKASEAIMEAKRSLKRPFTSKKDFIDNVARRVCNVRVQDALDKIGSFASIEPSQLPILHPDRLKDQKTLIPSVMQASVKADRKLDLSEYAMAGLASVFDRCNYCDKCELAGTPHPVPRIGRSPKVMIITEGATGDDCATGTVAEGKSGDFLKTAIKSAGMKLSDVYITTFIKGNKKEAAEGQVTNDMIIGCSSFLDEEIALTKPAVVLLCGSKIARHMLPDLKGGWEEICGKEVYDASRDMTFIVGMNPQMIWMDDSKQSRLNQVMSQVAALLD